MRLIDADRLVKCFCAHCTSMGEDGVCREGGECFDKKIIDHTPTVEAEPVWTPADIEPPKNGKYLTLQDLYGSDFYDIAYYGDYEDEMDAFKVKCGWYYYDDEYGTIPLDDVRYWMPMPEPPKEGEE